MLSNTDWIIECDDSWCKVFPQSGFGDKKLKIFIDKNEDKRKRTTTIKVKNQTLINNIKINQNKKRFILDYFKKMFNKIFK